MSICAICVEISNNPVCCIPCGHVYCKQCIDEWIINGAGISDCPVCRKAITDVKTIYFQTDESKDIVVAENTTLKAKLIDYKDENAKLGKQMTHLTNMLQNQKRITAKRQDKIANVLRNNEGMVQKIRKLKEHITLIVEKKDACFQDKIYLDKLAADLQEQNGFLLTENDVLRKRYAHLQEQNGILLNENDVLRKRYEHLLVEKYKGILRHEHDVLPEMYAHLQDLMDIFLNENDELRKRYAHLQEQNDILLKENYVLRKRYSHLQEQILHNIVLENRTTYLDERAAKGCWCAVLAVLVVNVAVLLVFYAGSHNFYIQMLATALINIFNCIQFFFKFLLNSALTLFLIVLTIRVNWTFIKGVVETTRRAND